MTTPSDSAPAISPDSLLSRPGDETESSEPSGNEGDERTSQDFAAGHSQSVTAALVAA